MSQRQVIFWLVLLTLLWPGLQLSIFLLRFNRWPPGGLAESLVFVPMGAVAGAALLFLLGRARGAKQRRATIIGYVLASPVALIGSLLGGLVLPPIIGALVFGALPLMIGAAIGYALGKRSS